MIPLIDLKAQFGSIKDILLKEIETVIDNGQYILGPKVRELEEKIKDKLNVEYVVSVANGTDALVITLEACGIGAGDEVITTPFTFFATAEAIMRVGATPVFVDIDRHTYTIDPKLISEKITGATKAILPVHLFGQPANMTELQIIAQKHSLILIEDACQAFGATFQGRKAGTLSDAACFSFFPSKNLSTMGDGGMIVTSNAALADRIRKLRTHGSKRKYYHDSIGYNSRLDEIHAAILLITLDKIDQWNEKRRELATRYREKLMHVQNLNLPYEAGNRTHIYHLFCVYSLKRAQLMRQLKQNEIQCGTYYPCPLHLQAASKYLGYRRGDFPIAEEMSTCLLAIPIGPFLSEVEQDKIITTLMKKEEV